MLFELLEFDRRASFLELFLHFFCFSLCDTFLDRSGSAFDKFLGVSKTEAVTDFTHCFNNSDLVVTEGSKDDVKFIFFFSSGFATSRTSNSNGSRSCGANAPLFFESLHKVCDFENGQAAQFFYDFISISHFLSGCRRRESRFAF